MNTNSVQQEILLVIDTTLASLNLFEDNSPSFRGSFNKTEQLEEACWNGFLQEILPKSWMETSTGGQLYLWKIRECNSFLEIDMGEFPSGKDNYLSIDPYYFLAVLNNN
jgi:hypothetical protein